MLYHQKSLAHVKPGFSARKTSQIFGAVRGVDPETGQPFDDTRRYVETAALSASDKAKIFDGNARRVYPRWKPAK